MKKYFLIILLTICFLLDFISCRNSSSISLSGDIRISLVSPYNDKVEAKVYIEGPDGNIVNGAIVSIKDSANTVSLLDYSFQQGCYYKLIDKPSAGFYTLVVKSKIFGSPVVYSIPHTYLEDSIDYKLIEMTNQIGQSYQKYDSFDTSYPIRITWCSATDDCTYKVIIRTPLKILYETSTNNKTIEIPAYTIPAGTAYVYLQIQQQKSYGDILFEDADYYSVSVFTTGNISFNVQ